MARQNQQAALLIMTVCAVLACALFLAPAWIIQPFRAQSPGQLAWALAIRRIAPIATLVLLVIGIGSVYYARPRRWKAVFAGACLMLLAFAAAAVRINYFEWMFHPNAAPTFVAVHDAGVDADDMVMVARLDQQARAYPVRIMAYHHLLNDTVGGVPIVPTY
jgi:hypothetical protein